MKKIVFLLFASMILFSCSKDEVIEQNQDLPTTRAGLLTATPTSLNFYQVVVGTSMEQDVLVSVSGLPALSTLTGLNLQITGTNANQFSAELPNLSLAELLSNLLSGNQTVNVKYTPTVANQNHTAQLKITATVLGISTPLTATVQLSGRGFPKLLPDNIFPANNSTGVAISSDIYVEYNQLVNIVDPQGITINGQPAARVEIFDRYFLKIYNTASGSNLLERNTQYTINIAAGAVTGTRNNPSEEDLSFTFKTAANITYTVNPPIGSTINLPVDSEAWTVTITFSENVQLPENPFEVVDEGNNYYAYVSKGSTPNTVVVNFLAVNVYSNYPSTTMIIPAEKILDMAGNPLSAPIILSYALTFYTPA